MAAAEGRSLEETPTWAVAVVCLVFIAISIILDKSIGHAGKWLLLREMRPWYEVLDKIKSELMIVGFISILLTIGQQPISKICISKKIAYSMLPCDKKKVSESKYENDEIHRKLLWASMSSNQEVPWRRILASAAGGLDHCSQKGMYPLVSQGGMHQLHIFIFILAIIHVLYSVITIGVGRAKMRPWRLWEKEIQTNKYQFSYDPARFRLAREISFIRHNTRFWRRIPILKWIVCFFRQFFLSVTKDDYLTLRDDFIMAHLSTNSKFDFHKYMRKSLEMDGVSMVIVGISPPLWAFAVVLLLLNVSGWYAYFWLSFVPLSIVLFVGTKLQVILTDMALEIRERHAVVKGTPVLRPRDKLFWFNRPKLILFLIHFILFQNSFQLAFFLWIWYAFGLRSCFHSNFVFVMIRVAMGIAVQFLCSYITLPLYTLVTQVNFRVTAIFEEHIADALKKWHQKAKKRIKKNRGSESGFRSGESTPSHGSDIESSDIPHKYHHSENEASEYEMEEPSPSPSPSPHHPFSPHHAQPLSTSETENTTTQQSTAKITQEITELSFAAESIEIIDS